MSATISRGPVIKTKFIGFSRARHGRPAVKILRIAGLSEKDGEGEEKGSIPDPDIYIALSVFSRFVPNRLLGWLGRYYHPGKTLSCCGGFVHRTRMGCRRPWVTKLQPVRGVPENRWPVATQDISAADR
jgi:hypothetical protein